MCFCIAFVLGAILNCVVFPIGFIFFHDCGKWICNHEYPMTMESFFIITGIVWGLLFVIAALCEFYFGDSNPFESTSNYNNSCNRITPTHRTSQRSYYSERETDYYDSDMEGAPGYYGGW